MKKSAKEIRKRSFNEENSGDQDDEVDDDHYLHPLLSGASHKSEPPPKPFPSVNLDTTPYGKLIRCLGIIQQREDLKRNNQVNVQERTNNNQATDSPVPAHIVPPPPDVFPIIDKLADYVARNGQIFEDSVRAKNDPRFDFVDENHVHHAYYVFRKDYYLQEIQKRKGKSDEAKKAENTDKKCVHGSGIKFLIKARDNAESSLPLTPLHLGGDDDQEDGGSKKSSANETERTERKCDPDKEIEEQLFVGIGPQGPPKELLDQMKQQQMENERKKDKLLVVARVKLAQESKEKQEERKRKADLFIKQLREAKERQAAVAVEKMDREAAEKAALKNSLMAKLLSVNTTFKDRAARSITSDSFKHVKQSSAVHSPSPDISTRKDSGSDSRYKRRQEHRRRSRSRSHSRYSPFEKNIKSSSKSDLRRSSRSSPTSRISSGKSDFSYTSKNILDLDYLPSKKRTRKH